MWAMALNYFTRETTKKIVISIKYKEIILFGNFFYFSFKLFRLCNEDDELYRTVMQNLNIQWHLPVQMFARPFVSPLPNFINTLVRSLPLTIIFWLFVKVGTVGTLQYGFFDFRKLFSEHFSNSLSKLRSKHQFWTPGLFAGVLSNHPYPLSVRVPFFKYIRDCSLVFLKRCMKLGANKLKNVTQPKFKNLNTWIKGD